MLKNLNITRKIYMLSKVVAGMVLIITITICGFLASMNIGITALEVQAAQPKIRVTIDGRPVNFPDQPPVIIDGRTLVPIRGVFEDLGFGVWWEEDTQTATISEMYRHVTITIGSRTFITNDVIYMLDVPAQIINDRTMLPIRAVVESVGYSVEWDAANNTVVIITDRWINNVVTPPAEPSEPIQPPVEPPVQDITQPPATVPGFVDINGIAPVYKADVEWEIVLQSTTSSITLQNRRLTAVERQIWIDEYNALGGANTFELEVVRLVNEIRVEYGLSMFEIDETLMMAARFYSQTIGNLNLTMGHNEGPYGGSRNTVHAFGRARGVANGNAGARTPEAVVDSWMNSPGHRENLLRQTSLSRIGFGSHMEQQRTLHYFITGE